MHEMRSPDPARARQQLDLFGDPAPVGGRHAPQARPDRGGGYLNECTSPEVAHWPQKNFAHLAHLPDRERLLIGELYAMGLSRVLLRIAETIGFDAFMQVWGALESSPEVHHDASAGLRLQMPRLAAYRRYQRNRFVEALAVAGLTEAEIRATVKARLGESISDRHTRRLMRAGRIRT